MTVKTKPPAKAKAPPADKGSGAGMTAAEKLKARAMMATSGVCSGAAGMEPFQKNMYGADVDFMALQSALSDRVEKIREGDLHLVESMLISQAITLQTMFTTLIRRGAGQEYLKQYQTYMGLGLKAQAQSRATLEALIEMKQPRQQATFVKQANIAHGPQQVNNGVSGAVSAETAPVRAGTHPLAENSQGAPNKLLEVDDGQRLDFGAQAQAGGADTHMEALEAVNRAGNARR